MIKPKGNFPLVDLFQLPVMKITPFCPPSRSLGSLLPRDDILPATTAGAFMLAAKIIINTGRVGIVKIFS
jgi:hypothetical protein